MASRNGGAVSGAASETTSLKTPLANHNGGDTKSISTQPAPEKANTAFNVQSLTDRALQFLSTASNETIGACMVGLGAGTYVILGRVGLVLIGVVGGVVLHATWEGTRGGEGNSKATAEKRRRETGLDIIHRVLNWRSRNGDIDPESIAEVRVDKYGLSVGDLEFEGFKPETAEALRAITDAVIRDYVFWWYGPIVPGEQTFPLASRITLTSFMLGISNNLASKRPADVFLNFVTHVSSTIVVFLNELATAINASPNASAADAVKAYVQLKPDSNLANVLDVTQQRKKLALVAEDILQTYLEPKTYNCQPAHVFLRQILANTVIDNTIERCSKPEWINDWIVFLLEEGEPELLKSVDASLEGSTGDAKANVTKEAANLQKSHRSKDNTSDIDNRAVVTKGQEAFDDAMKEAARLTRMIQEEEEKRLREEKEAAKRGLPLDKQQSPNAQDAILAAASAIGGVDMGPLNVESTPSVDEQLESATQSVATPTSSQSDRNGVHDPEPDRMRSTDSQRSESPATASAESEAPPAHFTNFDQLDLHSGSDRFADFEEGSHREREPLTLFQANLVIFDDSMPGDKQSVKAKPVAEYLIQIEPASSDHSGWMVAKRYSELEMVHESLRRISAITGSKFHELHPTVPPWKGQTKSQLRESLERYLNDAVRAKSLAESEAMRRFLEKEQGLMKSPGNKGGINAAFGAVGKGIEGGGKAIVGGVSGVFGGGGKRTQSNAKNFSRPTTTSPQARTDSALPATAKVARQSTDSLRKTISQAQVEGRSRGSSELGRRPSVADSTGSPTRPRADSPSVSSVQAQSDPANSRPPSIAHEPDSTNGVGVGEGEVVMQLPPPPSMVPDDYDGSGISLGHTLSSPISLTKTKSDSVISSRTSGDLAADGFAPLPSDPLQNGAAKKPAAARECAPLNEREATVAVELLFAVITELYTLSSAWSLRRTLLNAAKAILLRPGNVQLASIRELLQSTVLDANASDVGIAAHLRKLRENSLPTEEELATWPPELDARAKEELRVRARKLLVAKGMPVALTSVMGQAASGEAMGRLFDCLQVEEVARGLMFGLMLQGIRIVVQ